MPFNTDLIVDIIVKNFLNIMDLRLKYTRVYVLVFSIMRSKQYQQNSQCRLTFIRHLEMTYSYATKLKFIKIRMKPSDGTAIIQKLL